MFSDILTLFKWVASNFSKGIYMVDHESPGVAGTSNSASQVITFWHRSSFSPNFQMRLALDLTSTVIPAKVDISIAFLKSMHLAPANPPFLAPLVLILPYNLI